MTLLPIVTWPDPLLREVCVPVAEDEDVGDLVRDMLETMYDAPGRGLAAPQVGVAKRVFVMDCGWKDGTPAPRVCVNPEIVSVSGEAVSGEEGCLSIPGVLAGVERPEAVTLRYRDVDGGVREVALRGFEARCAQHELDHLNGILTLDRLTPEARAEAERAYALGAP
ncbi:MAG: peptide deformylase [Sediminimonas sp.]|uniref:peptide deformylase n=1 Tax=Sediminimonas sp. TaxID=2823379 RepID=UPI00286FDDBF|nr:peptide deformylase [Sediminimonas sp.]MDR9484847.1 peptide deformylase [Sediminimonas sp.]